jgi:hypothetical protein
MLRWRLEGVAADAGVVFRNFDAALIYSRETISIADAAAPEGHDWFWFRVWSVQVREVWVEHGAWIEATHPRSSALSRKHLETGAESTPERNG